MYLSPYHVLDIIEANGIDLGERFRDCKTDQQLVDEIINKLRHFRTDDATKLLFQCEAVVLALADNTTFIEYIIDPNTNTAVYISSLSFKFDSVVEKLANNERIIDFTFRNPNSHLSKELAKKKPMLDRKRKRVIEHIDKYREGEVQQVFPLENIQILLRD